MKNTLMSVTLLMLMALIGTIVIGSGDFVSAAPDPGQITGKVPCGRQIAINNSAGKVQDTGPYNVQCDDEQCCPAFRSFSILSGEECIAGNALDEQSCCFEVLVMGAIQVTYTCGPTGCVPEIQDVLDPRYTQRTFVTQKCNYNPITGQWFQSPWCESYDGTNPVTANNMADLNDIESHRGASGSIFPSSYAVAKGACVG